VYATLNGGESYAAMKTRIIQTRFWKDEKVHQMSASAQHLFIYLLTCDSINLCGVFELPDDYISVEAKLDGERLTAAKAELERLDRVRFYNGWIYVVNVLRYNHYHNSPLTELAFKKELMLVPQEILAKIKYTPDSTMDSTMDTRRNKKSKIRNKKLEIRNKKEDPEERLKGDLFQKGLVISDQV
jgi:hypothetical protein